MLETSKFAPSLGPVPLPPTPPQNRSPWTPPEPLYPPHPTGHLQKTPFLFDFHTTSCSVPGARAPTTYPPGIEALGPPPSPNLGPRVSGLTFRNRNLLTPWCPCPYHLPPRNRSPWTFPPSPCNPPHPTGHPSKTPFFFLYALETSKIRHKLRNLLRPWGPCPYHCAFLSLSSQSGYNEYCHE